MDYKYIEQLLSRYFEATSTLKEEQILKTFFAQDDEELPQGLRQYKSLFAAMEQTGVLGDDFDDRIIALIAQEGKQPENTEEERAVSQAKVISLSERFRPLLRAAAAVAIILTLSTAINQSFRDDNVWNDEDQIARYQDELRKAALASANADSVLLYSEGIALRTDTLMADTLLQAQTGYIE